MFEHQKLEYYYTVQAPAQGGTNSLELITGYDKDDVKIKNYLINDDIKRVPIENILVYSTGLVVFQRSTLELNEFYSNMSFELKDDGKFYLASK